MRIGYGRVSTLDQNPDAQRDALTKAQCDRIFIDKASGTLASRPELDRAIDTLRAKDVLVITKLDRLGRSVKNLIDLVERIQQLGAELVILDQQIDTTTPMGKFFFTVLAAFAEFERNMIAERTRDGLAAARSRGKTGGQKPKLTPRQARIAQEMYDELGADGKRAHTVQQIAEEFGVTRATIYRYLDRKDTNRTR
jgi:DNA invertase Pin-like site-specific DNA recombinase